MEMKTSKTSKTKSEKKGPEPLFSGYNSSAYVVGKENGILRAEFSTVGNSLIIKFKSYGIEEPELEDMKQEFIEKLKNFLEELTGQRFGKTLILEEEGKHD